MADAYLAAHILDFENRIQRLEQRADRQVLREIEEPFDLTVEFRELYRLTPELISDLVDVLAPHLMHTRITGLSVEKQICNPNLKILNVNARFPEARHDAYIWSASAARGDLRYPLEPWLLTPLPRELEGTLRFLYNEAMQEIAWNDCLEYLKARGDAFLSTGSYSMNLALQEESLMCAVLHNMRIAGGILNDDPFEDYANKDVSDIHIDDDDEDDNLRPLALARRIQDRLIAERFGR
ncbi:nuclease harbi1 [Lasius niger]|uniref:Nuclease harbi1 n=1 Tax=Lasius niger TaxID=67767 RepID=A0A0J7K0G0_LASNI|nr:nuclease harbi1 [Lasius niger]